MSLVRAGRRFLMDGHGMNTNIVEEASRIRVLMSSRHHHHHHHHRHHGLVASSQIPHRPSKQQSTRRHYHSGTNRVVNDWSLQHHNHHGKLHWKDCCRFSSSSKDNCNGEDHNHNASNHDTKNLDETNDTTSPPSNNNNNNNNNNNITTPNDDGDKEFQIPGAQAGGKKFAIVYTCKVCDTRSVKQFSEHSYNNGVVLVKCPGCQNLHLIADRLGIFGDNDFDIQKVMAQFGEQVQVVNNDTVLELTVEDIVGKELLEKLTSSSESSTAVDSKPNDDDDDDKKT